MAIKKNSLNTNEISLGFDKITITASLIGFISLFFKWFTLKPNRLSVGESISLLESAGWPFTIFFATLWLFCLLLGFIREKRKKPLVLGIIVNIILILFFVILGLVSKNFADSDITLISPGFGIWINVLAAYIILFSINKGLGKKVYLRYIFSWFSPVIFIILLISGYFNNLSILIEYNVFKSRFIQEFLHHIFLVFISVLIGSIIGVFLGIWATKNKKAQGFIFFVSNISQTIPSLALFGLLIAPLSLLSFKFPVLREIGIRGIGNAPAIIALTIYALLPIVRNTYVSIRQLDLSVIDAAKGMGMNRIQIFRKIELPLSVPLIFEGIRISAVQSIGLTVVAALIGAGGLGWFVFQGLGQAAPDMVLLGAIPIIILAIITDSFMRLIIRLVTPNGITRGKN